MSTHLADPWPSAMRGCPIMPGLSRCARKTTNPSPGSFPIMRDVAFGVGDVKVALAPLRVLRNRLGPQTLGDGTTVQAIHIGDKEDDPPPPRPSPIRRLGDQIHVRRSCEQAGERGGF